MTWRRSGRRRGARSRPSRCRSRARGRRARAARRCADAVELRDLRLVQRRVGPLEDRRTSTSSSRRGSARRARCRGRSGRRSARARGRACSRAAATPSAATAPSAAAAARAAVERRHRARRDPHERDEVVAVPQAVHVRSPSAARRRTAAPCGRRGRGTSMRACSGGCGGGRAERLRDAVLDAARSCRRGRGPSSACTRAARAARSRGAHADRPRRASAAGRASARPSAAAAAPGRRSARARAASSPGGARARASSARGVIARRRSARCASKTSAPSASRFSIVTASRSPGVAIRQRYVISIGMNGETCSAFSCRLSSTWSAFPLARDDVCVALAPRRVGDLGDDRLDALAVRRRSSSRRRPG